MKKKISLLLFILLLSFSALSDNYFKDFFNIDIFSKNPTSEKTYYYPNGQLKSKQFFIGGKRSGTWQYFHDNGKPKSSIIFSENFSDKEIGSVINYDKNGVIVSDGKFVDNIMTSLWNYYDENGKKIYSLNHNTDTIVVFNENEEAIFYLSEEELASKLEEIQKEIKNDRIKSAKEND